MAVEASRSVGADVEYLRELEGVLVVHIEGARDEDQHAVGDGTRLHVLVVDLVYDLLEAERLNLLQDLFAPRKGVPTVGHGASVQIEVDQPVSVRHHRRVVLHNKFVSNRFNVHLYEIIQIQITHPYVVLK